MHDHDVAKVGKKENPIVIVFDFLFFFSSRLVIEFFFPFPRLFRLNQADAIETTHPLAAWTSNLPTNLGSERTPRETRRDHWIRPVPVAPRWEERERMNKNKGQLFTLSLTRTHTHIQINMMPTYLLLVSSPPTGMTQRMPEEGSGLIC